MALVLGAISALRFDAAIPLPAQRQEAYSLVFLGSLATVAVASATSIATIFLRQDIAGYLGLSDIEGWLWAVPSIAGLIGIFGVLNQFAIRERRYSAVARRNFLQGATMAIGQIAAGVAGLSSGGMLIGFGAGQGIGMLSLVRGTGLRSEDARAGRTVKSLRAAVIRYRRFPLLLAPSGLLNLLGLHVPILLIASLYGSEVAGWLGMTQRVLALPMSLIGMAVAQVFLAELSRSARSDGGSAEMLFIATSKRLAIVGSIFLAILVAAGPFLFRALLGSQWGMSGSYARLLSVTLALQFIASPLSQTLTVYERQWTQLGWDMGRFAFVTASILVANLIWNSAPVTILTFGLSGAVMYSASWALSYRTVTSYRRQ